MSSTVASAAILSNLLGLESSLRTTSLRMMLEAEDEAQRARPPGNLCPARCRATESPRVVFESGPRKRLERYGDHDKCEQLLDTTRDTPLVYDDRHFDTVDGALDWLTSFAQGRGEDGRDMFARCDGRCSPDYKCVIEHDDGEVLMSTAVVCGHARDRGDNKFELSYSLRWTCEDR
jgi:hypothetical protein